MVIFSCGISSWTVLFAAGCFEIGKLKRRSEPSFNAWILFASPWQSMHSRCFRSFPPFRIGILVLIMIYALVTLVLRRRLLLTVNSLRWILCSVHMANAVLGEILFFDQRQVCVAFHLVQLSFHCELFWLFWIHFVSLHCTCLCVFGWTHSRLVVWSKCCILLFYIAIIREICILSATTML